MSRISKRVQTLGSDLSCVCTRESLTSTVHLMWSSRLPQSQLNPMWRLRLIDHQEILLAGLWGVITVLQIATMWQNL
ncbi:uncharacterized protein LOC130745311 [Lotus japonicus]|uniref:uncharacterized protein LOC130745311 n=1 Tax=Lotus japonicus TaxID=34305 RepID=UPI002589B833|nr:uncharacterized protein LOC130745311 [Lotus japonicus]